MAASPGRRTRHGSPRRLVAPPSRPSGRGFIWTPSGLKPSATPRLVPRVAISLQAVLSLLTNADLGFEHLLHHGLDVLLIDEWRQDVGFERHDRRAVTRRAVGVSDRDHHTASGERLVVDVVVNAAVVVVVQFQDAGE